ncbi:MAG: hypothetical protein ACW991_09665 [Candidatus Hodarchaeales archaeon]|jgi:hypothetical protein
MNKKEEKEEFQERVERATKKLFKEWDSLDKIKEQPQESLEFLKHLEELVRREVENEEGEIKIVNTIKKMVRTRKDLGEIILGDNVIKKIEIIDEYKGKGRPLKSIAYFYLLPVMDARKPIAHVLEWTVSHHPCWVIWYTSPVAKGLQSRTEGEYLVVHSLNEEESEDYELLLKFSKYPCFGRSDGIDILLGYEKSRDAVEFVEEFLHTIIERNLYGDPKFLQFLQNYQKTKLELADT